MKENNRERWAERKKHVRINRESLSSSVTSCLTKNLNKVRAAKLFALTRMVLIVGQSNRAKSWPGTNELSSRQ
jgi:hypothetical protein